jgi:hypothetical protein
MRMFCWRGYGYCQDRSLGHGNCGCHGRSHGHGGCGCHGRSHYHGYPYPAIPLFHLDALEILRRRYASGEIDDTTFEHMRERLGPSVGSEQPPLDSNE